MQPFRIFNLRYHLPLSLKSLKQIPQGEKREGRRGKYSVVDSPCPHNVTHFPSNKSKLHTLSDPLGDEICGLLSISSLQPPVRACPWGLHRTLQRIASTLICGLVNLNMLLLQSPLKAKRPKSDNHSRTQYTVQPPNPVCAHYSWPNPGGALALTSLFPYSFSWLLLNIPLGRQQPL